MSNTPCSSLLCVFLNSLLFLLGSRLHFRSGREPALWTWVKVKFRGGNVDGALNVYPRWPITRHSDRENPYWCSNLSFSGSPRCKSRHNQCGRQKAFFFLCFSVYFFRVFFSFSFVAVYCFSMMDRISFRYSNIQLLQAAAKQKSAIKKAN